MSEEETNPEEVIAPEVNMSDFATILQIIDVASTRGAFKGNELSSVGVIRDRVAAFVNFYTPAAEAPAEAPAEASDEATTESQEPEVTEETSE